MLVLIVISTFPLLIINLIWFNSSSNQILSATSDTLITATIDKTHQIESFIALKKIGLTIHSQTDSFLKLQIPNITNELKSLFLQDQDITEAVIIDKSGKEIIRMTRDHIFSEDELIDQSSSPAFKVPTFVGGQEYISPIYIDQNGDPSVYMAIPIVNPDQTQVLQNLSTSSTGSYRKTGEIFGVLKVHFKLTNLWKEITENKIGNNGYAFVMDDKGNVITHKDNLLFRNQANLKGIKEVDLAIEEAHSNNNSPLIAHESENEYHQRVLITHANIPSLNWIVIAQIPLSDTFAAINRAELLATILFIISFNFIIIAGFWISNQIVNPIRLLQQGARLMGQGHLDDQLSISTGDEIEDLTNDFNTMARNLKQSISQISGEKNKLRVLLYGITDAVIAVDSKRKILTFNKAAEVLTGYLESEVVGTSLDQVIHLSDKTEVLTIDTYSPLQSGDFEGIVFNKKGLKLTGKHNKISYINVITGQIKEGPQIDLGSILTLHDVTAEIQLEEMKLDFVSIAAHELRTPLTSLKGYTYIMIRDYSKTFDDKAMNIMTRINISTQKLVGLVENLLNVARIEKGALTVHASTFDWGVNIQEVIYELLSQANDKHIKINFLEPKAALHVWADKLRINEVLTNLIANAINYTPKGGQIWVWAFEENNQIITCVKDSGEGIPAAAIEHLFNKFFRVSGRLEQGSKGTGLGLYISKSIVEMHNGKIAAASEGLGKGSTFWFTLPKEEVHKLS